MNLSYTLPKAEENIKKGIKIHTLRDDPSDRWKEGVIIHHCYSFRSKDGYSCFLKGQCTGYQKVLIVYDENKNSLVISINRKKLSREQASIFIANDGFESKQSFIDWFFPANTKGKRKSTMTTKKIIHWTNYRY